jgi:hypothetical protein
MSPQGAPQAWRLFVALQSQWESQLQVQWSQEQHTHFVIALSLSLKALSQTMHT